MPLIKSIEHRIKDLVFLLIQFFLRKSDPAMIPVDLSQAKRILFLRHDLIGDMIISLPVFAAIKKQYPNLQLDLLCSTKNATVVKDDPVIDQIYIYRKSVKADLSTIFNLRCQGYDAVIDLINSDSTSGLILTSVIAANAPRIGVQKKKYKRYYDFTYFTEPADFRHTIRNTLMVLIPFGIDPEQVKVNIQPFLSLDAKTKADRFIADLQSDSITDTAPKLIGLNLSVGKPTRRWPLSKYQELLERITQEFGNQVKLVLFTAPKERHLAEQVLEAVSDSAAMIPPAQSLEEVTAIIARLDLMISPDTSIIHIARAFGLPVVGLYTKAIFNFKQWHPFEFIHGAVVSADDNNLKDISVDQVMAKFTEITETIFSESKEAS